MADLTTLLNDLAFKNAKVTEGITLAEGLAALGALSARGEMVRVPEDYTLKEAVERVHGDDSLTTIVVGKGEHKINGKYLEISSAMHIVGDPTVPRADIVIKGGIRIKEGIQGNCHLQHLTVRQAKKIGVWGQSSFTMEDVLVEKSTNSGVMCSVPGTVAICTNIEVHQCEWSGVVAGNGTSIILIGPKTMVHGNSKSINTYGLEVHADYSTIQLVSPLTKEKVSIDNGGYNWGAKYSGNINQIKTITKAELAELAAVSAASRNVSRPLRF